MSRTWAIVAVCSVGHALLAQAESFAANETARDSLLPIAPTYSNSSKLWPTGNRTSTNVSSSSTASLTSAIPASISSLISNNPDTLFEGHTTTTISFTSHDNQPTAASHQTSSYLNYTSSAQFSASLVNISSGANSRTVASTALTGSNHSLPSVTNSSSDSTSFVISLNLTTAAPSSTPEALLFEANHRNVSLSSSPTPRPTCRPAGNSAAVGNLTEAAASCDTCPELAGILHYSSMPVPPHHDYTSAGYAPVCNAAWQQYTSASSAWWNLVGTRSTRFFDIHTSRTSRVLGRVAEPTVLADGFTRMKGHKSDLGAWIPTKTEELDHFSRPQSSVSTSLYSRCLSAARAENANHSVYFPNPTPACGISPRQCKHLESLQSKDSDSVAVCGSRAYRHSKCHIYASKVDVYYWPSPTAGASGVDSSLATNTTRSAIVGTNTLYSPSVYLSLERIGMQRTWTIDHSTISVDHSLPGATNTLMPLPPQSLFSVVYTVPGCQGLCPESLSSLFNTPMRPGQHLGYTTQPYDPATVNSNHPVAASAYFWGKVDAGFNMGRTPLKWIAYEPIEQVIWDDYLPQIAAPDQLRHLDPDWAGCNLGIGGIYDPPIVLTPADSPSMPEVTPPGGGPLPSPDLPSPGGISPAFPTVTPFQGPVQPVSMQGNSGSTESPPPPAPGPSISQATQTAPTAAPPSMDRVASLQPPANIPGVGPIFASAIDSGAPVLDNPPNDNAAVTIAWPPAGADVGISGPDSDQGSGAGSSPHAGADPGSGGSSNVNAGAFAGPTNEGPSSGSSSIINDSSSSGSGSGLEPNASANAGADAGPSSSGNQGQASGSDGAVPPNPGVDSDLGSSNPSTSASNLQNPLSSKSQAAATQTVVTNIFGEPVAVAALIKGQTVVANAAAATIDGNTVSLASGGQTLIINGIRAATFPSPTIPAPASLVAQATAVTDRNGQVNAAAVVFGQTLSADSPAMTYAGHTYTLDKQGNVVIDGSKTIQPSSSQPSSSAQKLYLFSIDPSSTITALQTITTAASGEATTFAIINGHTLRLGGPSYSSGGHSICMGPDGSLVFDITRSVTAASASENAMVAEMTFAPGRVHTATKTTTFDAQGRPRVLVLLGAATSASLNQVLSIDGTAVTAQSRGMAFANTVAPFTAAAATARPSSAQSDAPLPSARLSSPSASSTRSSDSPASTTPKHSAGAVSISIPALAATMAAAMFAAQILV